MFTGIKDKLLNVKKNVGLFAAEDTNVKPATKRAFNPQAGAYILQHFQDHWEEIHKLNEENAKSADNLAVQIETISKRLSTDKANMESLSNILTNSNLTSNITQCLTQVKELYNVCETVEQKLVDLENLLEDLEFDKMIEQHRHHLDNYKTRKQESLDNLNRDLEEQYRKKLADHETSKKLILEERQKVFQEAFKTDLEMYKSLGTIPKVDVPKSQNGAILEEIQLDFDQKELEQFFDDENGQAPSDIYCKFKGN